MPRLGSDLYIYDFDTEVVMPIVQDTWWDAGYAYAFRYPLTIYMDYRVACFGLYIPGNFDLSHSFALIHDLETGVTCWKIDIEQRLGRKRIQH